MNMSQFLFIVLFAGNLGLSIAFNYVYFGILDEWEDTEGACTVYDKMIIKSLKTGFKLIGNNNLEMQAGARIPLHQTWTMEAGLGWFIFRNTMNGDGKKLLEVEGGCENAKPGTKVILYKKETATDNNKFVINSDGTIQSLCTKDLYVRAVRSGRLDSRIELADVGNRSISEEDIRFSIEPL